jgi:hypothetical protein
LLFSLLFDGSNGESGQCTTARHRHMEHRCGPRALDVHTSVLYGGSRNSWRITR